jgi:hypothetical protein
MGTSWEHIENKEKASLPPSSKRKKIGALMNAR